MNKQALYPDAVDPVCGVNDGVSPTLDASYYKGCGSRGGVEREVVAVKPCCVGRDIVRRLTPLECERLQAYPDGWTDIGAWTDSKGKTHDSSDTARYKALGNSIATCAWADIIEKISDIICEDYGETPLMASLFDGIGGFPMLWERCNGRHTAIWASEIEEFPIAVTKYHFSEDETT